MAKAVQQYEGHHNEHAYLPVHVNEQEGLLLAGEDPKHRPCCFTFQEIFTEQHCALRSVCGDDGNLFLNLYFHPG